MQHGIGKDLATLVARRPVSRGAQVRSSSCRRWCKTPTKLYMPPRDAMVQPGMVAVTKVTWSAWESLALLRKCEDLIVLQTRSSDSPSP